MPKFVLHKKKKDFEIYNGGLKTSIIHSDFSSFNNLHNAMKIIFISLQYNDYFSFASVFLKQKKNKINLLGYFNPSYWHRYK